jgi:hypothetical protein
MRPDHWLYALAVFVLCLVTGVGYAVATRFRPFGGSVVSLGSALFEAAVVVFGGYRVAARRAWRSTATSRRARRSL